MDKRLLVIAHVGKQNMKTIIIFSIGFVAVVVLICSCRTQKIGFNSDEPQALVNLLVDDATSDYYNPPAAVLAHEKLFDMGTNASDTLVANVHDTRKACKCFGGDYSSPVTVGRVCYNLLKMQVEKQYWKGPPSFLDRDGVSDWWEKNKGRSLKALQIDYMEWAISQFSTNDIAPYIGGRSRGIFRAEIEEDLKKLQETK